MNTTKPPSQIPHLQRFSGKWKTKQLGEIAHINVGCKNNEDKNENGQYPFFVRSAIVERINSYCFDGEAILVPGEGGIESIFHYINGRFDCHQRVYMINIFSNDVCGKLVYYSMVLQFGSHAMQNTVKSTVDSLRLPTFKNFSFSLPQDIAEQRAIAEVLSDVDRLIEALDTLIAKKRAIKQATMQQLLTGKTRLPGFGGAWFEKPLIDLATITMGQSPPSMSYNQRGNGVPLIQGNADIKDRRTIDRVWTTQGSKYCDLGDLILTVRAPVGVVAVASKRACLGRGVCGLKPFGDSRFLFYALNNVQVRWQIFEQGSTFTAANSEQIGQFRLYLPHDENEQRAIADIFSDMDAEIAALAQRRDKTRAIKQGMMQQLLTGRVRLVRSDAATV